MSTTVITCAAGIYAADLTAASVKRSMRSFSTADQRFAHAVVKAAVTLTFAMNAGVVKPTGRKSEWLANEYPSLGSPRRVTNMLITGEAVVTLGLGDDSASMNAAAAIHSAVGYGVTADKIRQTVTMLAEGSAAPSAVEAQMSALIAEVKAGSGSKGTGKRAPQVKGTEGEKGKGKGEGGKVEATPDKPARRTRSKVLSDIATDLSKIRTERPLSDGERTDLAAIIGHVARLAVESGINRDALVTLTA